MPAPSTPARRPRSIPVQPPLPPRGDDAALVPEVLERPKDPREDEVMEDKAYEEFDTQDREPLAPIKPNYNLRRVLERLPKLLEERVVEKCCRRVLWRIVVEKCWRRVL